MRSDRARLALSDMRYHVDLAREFMSGMSREGFEADQRTVHAVKSCLEIISEASRRLPDELKARHPHIGWQQMAAAGNVYRHEYNVVEASQLWDTVTYHLPPLKAVIDLEADRLAAGLGA